MASNRIASKMTSDPNALIQFYVFAKQWSIVESGVRRGELLPMVRFLGLSPPGDRSSERSKPHEGRGTSIIIPHYRFNMIQPSMRPPHPKIEHNGWVKIDRCTVWFKDERHHPIHGTNDRGGEFLHDALWGGRAADRRLAGQLARSGEVAGDR